MGSTLMEIRPFSADDVSRVAALESANQRRPWSEGVLRDELSAENRVYLVATEEEVVGFAGLMVVGEEAHVTNLVVDEAFRGRGVGRRLLVELFQAAIDAGTKHLTLEVRTKNESARSLYSKFGLAPVGVRKGYYGDDDALILWVHDIDGEVFRERLEGLR